MKREMLKENMEIKSDRTPAPSGYVPPPSRRGKVMLNVAIERAAREQLKAITSRNGTTVQAVVRDLINEYFERNQEKPIA